MPDVNNRILDIYQLLIRLCETTTDQETGKLSLFLSLSLFVSFIDTPTRLVPILDKCFLPPTLFAWDIISTFVQLNY